MIVFSTDVSNNGNKLATPLESQTSILEEFMVQSGEVTVNYTIDTLMICSTTESTKNFLILALSPTNTRELSAKIGR